MKVIKVDIQKHTVEAPEGTVYLKYMVSSNLVGFLDNKKTPDGPMFTEVHYMIRKLKSPSNEISYYAVKEDENRIFNDLISVSNQYIFEKVQEKVNMLETEFNTMVIPNITESTRNKTKAEIRALPWLDRLLNRF